MRHVEQRAEQQAQRAEQQVQQLFQALSNQGQIPKNPSPGVGGFNSQDSLARVCQAPRPSEVQGDHILSIRVVEMPVYSSQVLVECVALVDCEDPSPETLQRMASEIIQICTTSQIPDTFLHQDDVKDERFLSMRLSLCLHDHFRVMHFPMEARLSFGHQVPLSHELNSANASKQRGSDTSSTQASGKDASTMARNSKGSSEGSRTKAASSSSEHQTSTNQDKGKTYGH